MTNPTPIKQIQDTIANKVVSAIKQRVFTAVADALAKHDFSKSDPDDGVLKMVVLVENIYANDATCRAIEQDYVFVGWTRVRVERQFASLIINFEGNCK